uniref:Si:ch211-213d14.1 n=1 Tax=Tetraodon nigroviridis TaxID=99883 RepID=H3DA46_TETNG
PPGSHALPAYYGVRRPFLSDSDFSAKPFSADVYSTTLAAKPLSCEAAAAAVGGYPSFIDSYYPDAFADYLPSSALSSLLPGYGGESSHLFLRDSWDPEPVPQVEPLCADGLASVPPPMGSPDPPGSPSHYRSPSRAPYALHPLEDAHYHPLTPSPRTPSPPPPTPPRPRRGRLGAEAEGAPCWPKEDGLAPWPPYELRRPF